MNDQKILRRIEKCLALAASNNPNESAAALRQARAMMDKHKIDESTIRLNKVDYMSPAEEFFKSAKIDRHTSYLCATIALAFGLRVYLHSNYRTVVQKSGKRVNKYVQVPVFYGIGSDAEIASYTFEVVNRQLLAARKAYTKGLSSWMDAPTKKKHADYFCEGWVTSITAVVREFSGKEDADKKSILDEYQEKELPRLRDIRTRNREVTVSEARAHTQGYDEAKDVKLFRGTGHQRNEGIGRD